MEIMSYPLDLIASAVILIILIIAWRKKEGTVIFTNILMYVYIIAVFYVTLMPIITSLPNILNHPYVPMNLVPFDDLMNDRGDTVRQIVLNVVMMAPFGFLLPLCRECKHKGHGLIRTAFSAMLLSVFIELVQPLLSVDRASDITDVITNTAGGILGYIVFLIFSPLIYRTTRKN